MRRSASEVIRNLEQRVDRLEKQSKRDLAKEVLSSLKNGRGVSTEVGDKMVDTVGSTFVFTCQVGVSVPLKATNKFLSVRENSALIDQVISNSSVKRQPIPQEVLNSILGEAEGAFHEAGVGLYYLSIDLDASINRHRSSGVYTGRNGEFFHYGVDVKVKMKGDGRGSYGYGADYEDYHDDYDYED